MPVSEIPDRLCTWCKLLMMKRLVAGGQFIHPRKPDEHRFEIVIAVFAAAKNVKTEIQLGRCGLPQRHVNTW